MITELGDHFGHGHYSAVKEQAFFLLYQTLAVTYFVSLHAMCYGKY